MKLTLREENEKALKSSFDEACKNKEFVKLVNKLQLTKKAAYALTSKLENTVKELEHCKNCKGLAFCKNAYLGHVSMPLKNNDKVYFTYSPCRYTLEKEKEKEEKEELSKMNLKATFKDIDKDDKKRVKTIKWIISFFEDFDYKKVFKGLYLYGNFGCGKTFLIHALFNELTLRKQVNTEVVYYPELLRNLKNDWEYYEERLKHYLEIDLLCFDDIGAEKVTEWSRDEVLGTILQYRMDHNKTTFFTSNLSLEELENHFKTTNSLEEALKSRRIMERIKQLSIPMELLSENKRETR